MSQSKNRSYNLDYVFGQVEKLSDFFHLPLLTALITLAVINLILALAILTQIIPITKPSQLVTQVESANLPALRILEPKSGAQVSNNFDISLSYAGGDFSPLKKVAIFTDGNLQSEFDEGNFSSLKFPVDTSKFSSGQHKITVKVTNAKDSTQTVELKLNFVKGKKG